MIMRKSSRGNGSSCSPRLLPQEVAALRYSMTKQLKLNSDYSTCRVPIVHTIVVDDPSARTRNSGMFNHVRWPDGPHTRDSIIGQ